MCWHAMRWNLCEYMHPRDHLQIEPPVIPTRVCTDDGVYRQQCLPTRLFTNEDYKCVITQPMNNILTRVNPLLTFVLRITTIACLWFVLGQTSPDYRVWNRLGENPSDIPTIIVLWFRHVSNSRVWSTLCRTGTGIGNPPTSQRWVNERLSDDCASCCMLGHCKCTRRCQDTAPSFVIAFSAWLTKLASL